MLERKEKQLPIETVRLFSFYSFHCFTRSSSQHIYHQCLKSISFLYFSRDHLLVTIGIICGRGPLAVWGSSAVGIICGTVQWVACVFQGDWTNKLEDIIVARWYCRIEEILASKRVLSAKYLRSLVFEHSSILYRCSMQALYEQYRQQRQYF